MKKKSLRKPGNFIREDIPKEGAFIAFNSYMDTEEFHGHDNRARYRILVKFRNPMNLVKKFEDQFTDFEFGTAIEPHYGDVTPIPGTVHSYVLADFLVSRSPGKLDWGWTNLPVVKDKNLIEGYVKGRSVEKYVEDLMND